MLGKVFERFVEKSPISVMVRGTLERILGADQSNAESNAGRQHSDDLKHGCEVDAALSQVLVSLCLRQQACPWPQSQVWRGVYWPGSAVHGDSLSRSWTHGPGQDVKGSGESAGRTTGLALVFGHVPRR